MLNVFGPADTFFFDLLQCVELVCSSMPDKRHLSKTTSAQHMKLIKLFKSESFRRQFDRKSTLLCSIAMSGWCNIGI